MIPQFDKSIDNPKPESDWKDQTLPVDIVIFEGWCVGAPAQNDEKLVSPINNLERDEDSEGTFRKIREPTIKRAIRGIVATARHDRLDAAFTI